MSTNHEHSALDSPQDPGNNIDLHPPEPLQPTQSNASNNSNTDSKPEKEETRVTESEKKPPDTRHTGNKHDWAGSWTWEIGGAILSVVCIGLLFGFLGYVNGMAYERWEYSISPNAVVSVIAAFAKASMLIPVSACLSQLKWKQDRQERPMQLYHFHVLDQASRGPWGALEVFWRMKSTLPMAGAALTILAVALDPFAQQILAFPSREVQALDETAYVQRAQVYAPEWGSRGHEDEFRNTLAVQLDPTMQTAILSGLAQINRPLEPGCSSSHCEYPDFATLGVCSHCDDVTEGTIQTCQPYARNSSGAFAFGVLDKKNASTPANCSYTTPSGFTFMPETFDTSFLPPFTHPSVEITRQPWTSITTSKGHQQDDSGLLVSFFTAKYSHKIVYTPDNATAVEEKPTMTECSVHLCEKQYTNNHITDDDHTFQPSRSQPLNANGSGNATNGYTIQLIPPDGTKTVSDNSTYAMDYRTYVDLIHMLESLFNTTFVQDNSSRNGSSYSTLPGVQSAPVLYNSRNITESIAAMATSMTDNIRSGIRATRVDGLAYRTETYIHVRWPWIILPTMSVAFSIILFIATAVVSRGQPVLWKSSIFPFLMGRLETVPDHDIANIYHVDQVQSMSKKINVVVEGQENGPLLFAEREMT
ncbi:hypothetical protein ASPWEDRAFT_28805 [Aspergillus wentii DTO 134E9]|uniref:Uncharacterized protein n=1 Tax=Aspergillus wentii DTO 134E9 TaxID=1073089 RepID=A0A1L9RMQ7_ASPWE|nr:uncharacterized protein ASPWEDRAFT_28805 [Aspergillus wentii DTO 134E9]KAI9929323.1 hypothetical protein MW887_000791 [Aspergillus wentii]OJJ36240.1 hypothetical protein ASPWEDRAFT_28805 [Aspergillus wentii DTO 134E9]